MDTKYELNRVSTRAQANNQNDEGFCVASCSGVLLVELIKFLLWRISAQTSDFGFKEILVFPEFIELKYFVQDTSF